MTAEVIENTETGRVLKFSKSWIEFMEIIEKLWEIPLPPYIKEKLENTARYQTVFHEIAWSVAAPTAWLHFTPELIEKLKNKWVKIEKVLLHVWLWTFNTIFVDDIKDHKMHSEYIEIEDDTAKRLNQYKSEWKRIISVWTTSIRVLESFTDKTGLISSWSMDTQIFIYPGYKWKFVDAMFTNFHLPQSTLLMLVSSFAWKDNIDNAYKYAVSNKFRFFSFWDAMFIE
jgi:S-adenosylmethionine:tRNA ribosyltransferase-isomerase